MRSVSSIPSSRCLLASLFFVISCAKNGDRDFTPGFDSELTTAEGPSLRWAVSLEDELSLCSARIEGYAQLVGSTLVVGVSDNCSSGDGRLVALDSMTGTVSWASILGNPVVPGTPTYSATTNTFLVVSQPNNHPGQDALTSVAASDGAIQWSERGCGDGNLTHSPFVANGNIYTRCDDDGFAGTAAFRLEPGEQTWFVADGISVDPAVSPAYHEGTNVVFFGGQGVLQARDAENGEFKWKTGENVRSVSVLGDTIIDFEGADLADGNLKARSPLDGGEQWSVPYPGCWSAGLQVTEDGTLLRLGCGESGNEVAAINPSSGEELWSVSLPDTLAGACCGSPQPGFVQDQTIWMGTESGICAIDLNSGTMGSCVGDLGTYQRADSVHDHAYCLSRPWFEGDMGYCVNADDAALFAFTLNSQ